MNDLDITIKNRDCQIGFFKKVYAIYNELHLYKTTDRLKVKLIGKNKPCKHQWEKAGVVIIIAHKVTLEQEILPRFKRKIT